MSRLKLIAGGPQTGKTTSAGADARHTDDLGTDRPRFVQRVHQIAGWIPSATGTIEGATIPHALRHVMRENQSLRLDDVEIEFLKAPKAPTSKGQDTMAKGIQTVWNEIKPELVRRGAKVTER